MKKTITKLAFVFLFLMFYGVFMVGMVKTAEAIGDNKITQFLFGVAAVIICLLAAGYVISFFKNLKEE
jgi:hypothetical protein